MGQRSPLYHLHQAHGAKMTEFAGWELPREFTGIITEHRWVRTNAGLFDLSHLGKIRLYGLHARDLLQEVLTNDCRLLTPGKALYSPMCYPDGGCVDDLIVYALAEEEYLLVVNAVNTEKDLAWLLTHRRERQVTIEDVSSTYAQLALQGPAATAIAVRVLKIPALLALGRYSWHKVEVLGYPCLVARTGYTGEDGFEFYLPPEGAVRLWEAILADGQAIPVGLGARDTLRLEAGLPLYGHELTPEISPLAAGLDRFVALHKPFFIGRAALEAQAAAGPPRRLVGLRLLARGVPRSGYPVLADGREVGIITSGTVSPMSGEAIALALLDREAAAREEYTVRIRERLLPARRHPLPFYRRGGKKV